MAVVVVGCSSAEHEPPATHSLTSVTSTATPDQVRTNPSNSDSDRQLSSKVAATGADKELIMAWRKLFRASGIEDLEHAEIGSNDIEIRVWAVPDLYSPKTKCWIFVRKEGLWEGTALVDREFNGPIVRIRLDDPAHGWTDWDSYVNQNLLPQQVREVANSPSYVGDGIPTVLEVRFGKQYERRWVTNDELLDGLFKMVKSEFLNNDESR